MSCTHTRVETFNRFINRRNSTVRSQLVRSPFAVHAKFTRDSTSPDTARNLCKSACVPTRVFYGSRSRSAVTRADAFRGSTDRGEFNLSRSVAILAETFRRSCVIAIAAEFNGCSAVENLKITVLIRDKNPSFPTHLLICIMYLTAYVFRSADR